MTSVISFSFPGSSSAAKRMVREDTLAMRAFSSESSWSPVSVAVPFPSWTMTTRLWQLPHHISPDFNWKRGELHSGQLLSNIFAPVLSSSAMSFKPFPDRNFTASTYAKEHFSLPSDPHVNVITSLRVESSTRLGKVRA